MLTIRTHPGSERARAYHKVHATLTGGRTSLFLAAPLSVMVVVVDMITLCAEVPAVL